MNKYEFIVKLSRNPLGVIALSMLLVYSLASLLFGVAGAYVQISECQKWVLIYFIAGFPILLIIIFSYLVIWHHKKLYAPEDYKNEDNFMRQLSEKEKEEKFNKEMADTDDLSSSNCTTKNEQQTIAEARQETGDNHAKPAAATFREEYFKYEKLALDEVGQQFNLEIKRDICFDGKKTMRAFDGFATDKNKVYFFEVKYTKHASNLIAILSKTILNAILIKQKLCKYERFVNCQYILVLIVVNNWSEEQLGSVEKRIDDSLDESLSNFFIGTDVRYLKTTDLDKKQIR